MRSMEKLLLAVAVVGSMILAGAVETALAQGTLEIDIEVVGFDIQSGSEAETQLQQIASAGGGNYVPAEDAHKLMAAVAATVEKVLADQAPPPATASAQSDGWVFIQPADFGRDAGTAPPIAPRTLPEGGGIGSQSASGGTLSGSASAPPSSGSQSLFGGGQTSQGWQSLGGNSSSGSGGSIPESQTGDLKTEGPSAW